MSANRDFLYERLPGVVREEDLARGEPLRALMQVLAGQASVLHEDVDRLWDNLFIETCDPWVVPYIGDLVSNRTLFDESRIVIDERTQQLFPDLAGPDLRPAFAQRARVDVAKTIYYRLRKATLPMLEELARDVTGWPMHGVEFFERLGWYQHLEHVRAGCTWTDLRSPDRMERVGGPFDETSHTVDVRRIGAREGWHVVRNLGFFAFRLVALPLSRVPARVSASADWRFHFSPLGQRAPLFTRWRREGDETGLSNELHVPGPIRRAFWYDDLLRYRATAPARPQRTDLYGSPDDAVLPPDAHHEDASLFVVRNDVPVLPALDPTSPPGLFAPGVTCMALDPWPAAPPIGRVVAIDVASGRLAVGDGWADATDAVDVWFHAGSAAEFGGGEYDRRKWLSRVEPGVRRLVVEEGVTAVGVFPSLTDAIFEWQTNLLRQETVIEIADSRTYDLPGATELLNESGLTIEARNRERPLLRTPAGGWRIDVAPPAVAGSREREGALTLNGVVVEGHLHVAGDLGRLRLLHSTLVPGRALDEDGTPVGGGASVLVEPGVAAGPPLNDRLRIHAAFSILGRMEVPAHAEEVALFDSVLDAGADDVWAIAGPGGTEGPPVEVERSTILGGLRVRTLEMSESVTSGALFASRLQRGCVRFSYVRPGSRTPRRYRCQPDLAEDAEIRRATAIDPALSPAARDALRATVRSWLRPAFTTRLYGQPAYIQLRESVPAEILAGAEDGSEMGALCHRKDAQRAANLRIRLEEYLPFGREAGLLHVT